MTPPPSPTAEPTDRWDARWKARRQDCRTVSEWLRQCQHFLPEPGIALDLACGQGTNAQYLSQQGWRVLAIDRSREAVTQAAARLKEFPLAHAVQMDLECAAPAISGTYDLVLMMNFLHRPLFPWIRTILSPGGLFIGQAFSWVNAETTTTVRPEYALRADEWSSLFPAWQVLKQDQGQRRAKNGATLAAIAVRRPLR